MFSAEGRTVAEERQGGGGGFSAPSFNIPFQPNFQFNEFGSFLDGNGGFSQFISGLGSQVMLSNSDACPQRSSLMVIGCCKVFK